MANITFIISGGVPEYTVEVVEYGYSEIFPAEGEYIISGDFSGCFTLKVTDANGCVSSAYDCCPTVDFDAEFVSPSCEQTWQCDLEYNILEISFLTTTTTTTTCDPLFCDYGLLYNWYAVDTGKLAPTDWHVPTEAEFETLRLYVASQGWNYDGTTDAGTLGSNKQGKALSYPCEWSNSAVVGAVGNNDYPSKQNISGFAGLPAGYRYNGQFYEVGYVTDFWTTTVGDPLPIYKRLVYNFASNGRAQGYSHWGLSVRCVRDTYEGWENDLPFVDYDGNEYTAVELGTQLWLVQNLKTTHYNDGESIPNVTDGTEWMGLTTGALCAYNNDWETYACVPEPTTTTTTTVAPTTTTTTSSFTTTTSTTVEPTTTTTSTTATPTTTTTTTCIPDYCDYGIFYNGYVVDTGKIAPTGWHVPSRTELDTLVNYLNNNSEYLCNGTATWTAKSVAMGCGWKVNTLNDCYIGKYQPLNNSTGLSIVPSGLAGNDGEDGFYWRTENASIWLSSEEYPGLGTMDLNYTTQWIIYWWGSTREQGHNIRCIRDYYEGWENDMPVVDYDGNEYTAVRIGTQLWLQQNLKTSHFNDGEAIPYVQEMTTFMNMTIPGMRVYNNDWDSEVCNAMEPLAYTTTTTTTIEPTTTTSTTETPTTTTTTTTP